MTDDQNTASSNDYDLGLETSTITKEIAHSATIQQSKEKYKTGQETIGKDVEQEKMEKAVRYEFEIDAEKYHIGKPKRLILRGKIIHD